MLIPLFLRSKLKNLIKIWILILFSLFSTLHIEATMRVHPLPTKRGIGVRDEEDRSSYTLMGGNATKKLRRLPHVFSKVLELPFRSDADVVIEESPEFFRFVVKIEVDSNDICDDVRALAVDIHPGVTKIVVRNGVGGDDHMELQLDKLNVDTWRFRLPAQTRPELATAVFVEGKLIVTVPRVAGGQVQDGREVWGGSCGRLVLVQ